MFSFSKRSPHQKPWVMLTAYDANMTRAIEEAGADLILVGDSLGRAVLGYDSENEVSLEDMIHHGKAVLRRRQLCPVIIDLPYNTYANKEQALASAQQILSIGADAIKLEGPKFDIIAHLIENDIPVVAHLGYTPQSAPKEGSKVVGQHLEQAQALLQDCIEVAARGAVMLVIEMVPREVAATIAKALKNIPVIGIGCGPDVDGQVLVSTDMWGENDAPFKFLKSFGSLYQHKLDACRSYAAEVREQSYPADVHSFHIAKAEKDAWVRQH